MTQTDIPLELTDDDKARVTLSPYYLNADASARTDAIKLTGNSYANSLEGGSGDDTIIGGNGDDTLRGNAGADVFIYTSGNDVVTDYDDGDKISIFGAMKNATVDSEGNVVFRVGVGSLTVIDAADTELTVIDGKGNEFVTVIAAADDDDDDDDEDDEEISTTLTLTDDDKARVTLSPYYLNADASVRTSAIKLTGNRSANSLTGGEGDDTLNGGVGDDTLTGGDGEDLFIYNSGNDVITDYDDGDKISIFGAMKNATVDSEGNVVFKVGVGSLTVIDAADTELTVIDGKGNEFTTVISADDDDETFKTLTLTDDDKARVTLLPCYLNANASSRTDKIKLTGNRSANSLTGGDGSDTLAGGNGDDTLTGGAGNDVFVYNSGNDVITDYDDGDKIKIAGGMFSATVDGDDVVFKVGVGTLTVKDAAGVELSMIGAWGKKFTTVVSGSSDDSDSSAYAASNITGGGDDTLWGGAGSDTFVYSGGKDIIHGFGDDDMLEIMDDRTATYKKSAGDVVFKIGDGSVTLKDIDASAALTVNGDSYHIKGTKLVK